MQIQPLHQPTIPSPTGTSVQVQMDARNRAINKLMEAPQAQEHPVQNPTQVAPEEMGAIQQTHQASSEEPGQLNSNEATATPPEATISSQYNILARKERALRQHYQKLQSEREAVRAQEAAIKSREQQLSQYISRDELLKDPFGKLSELGVSYEQITNQALNQPSFEEQTLKKYQMEMDAKLKRIEEAQEAAQKSMEASQKQQYEQALGQIRTEVTHLVNNDPSYETIKATGQSHEVVKLIVDTFNQGLGRDYPKGSILPIEVAAQLVEDHIVEESLKLGQIKKIQAKWSASQTPPPQLKQTPSQQQQQPMRTLTNSTTTTRKLSAKERAVLAFNNQLK